MEKMELTVRKTFDGIFGLIGKQLYLTAIQAIADARKMELTQEEADLLNRLENQIYKRLEAIANA